MLASSASVSEKQEVEQLNKEKEVEEEIIINNQNLINRDIFAETAATETSTTNLYKFNKEANITVMILLNSKRRKSIDDDRLCDS